MGAWEGETPAPLVIFGKGYTRPMFKTAGSMERNSSVPWQPNRVARMARNRVLPSRLPWWITSSKAKLSKRSINSGSVSGKADTLPGNTFS